MLNKAICQKCIDRFFKKYRWNNSDEKRWLKNRLFCPYKSIDASVYADIRDCPPEACPYQMEHVVSNI